MLKLFRKRRASQRVRAATALFSPPMPAPSDAGGPIYAVGDVHGRHDLLARLMDRIFDDSTAHDRRPRIVFLGDYVDRGEGARETLDMLISLAERPDADCTFLMGNHEQMLLRFLHDPAGGSGWLRFGGLQTLMSYGIGTEGSLHDEGEVLRLRDQLAAALDPHLGFIERLEPCYLTGNLLFAHAGADPALPADGQEVATLLWGCAAFATADRDDGIWVIHGHIVVDRPVADHGRIAVDTGAYFSGRLTAARIADGEVTFIEG